ncbi:uncharacterized protein BO97DRAFT_460042 [Aspergillus homomorphus CBS 101889]|uniref:Ig-like domain-containing protein n=1 Tax=Aspergillus homomorphus (strain CBS 101889) TaxID=1450537 RepID=A0A395HMP9_ASPHC|nr:hypothetical protein BO97DRAFT_460042 [Aspergillus homomorphus CBS 101889]RAL08769.1 hypothetical protein BO97DRAFT_460042 [Aspergillus homomorphus CBS 101889]
MKLTSFLLASLLPAAILATPTPEADPEPEADLESRQSTVGSVSCNLFAKVNSKNVPAGCAPVTGSFNKGSKVTFTCQVFTDETWLRTGPSGSSFVRRLDQGVVPCAGFFWKSG